MITKKQKQILEFIKTYLDKERRTPSLKEIQNQFALRSPSAARYYVEKLQKGGHLTKERKQIPAPSINFYEPIRSPFIEGAGLFAELTGEELASVSVPIVGMANCGDANVMAVENIEGYLKVSQHLFDMAEGVFVVCAQGDSMNAANIRGNAIEDGDYVIIDSGYRHPKSGDYVLSIIDGCANLKRFSVNEDTRQITLVSESNNPTHKPIYVSSKDDFMINGKIIAVIKK